MAMQRHPLLFQCCTMTPPEQSCRQRIDVKRIHTRKLLQPSAGHHPARASANEQQAGLTFNALGLKSLGMRQQPSLKRLVCRGPKFGRAPSQSVPSQAAREVHACDFKLNCITPSVSMRRWSLVFSAFLTACAFWSAKVCILMRSRSAAMSRSFTSNMAFSV